ncbi:MAG TPA: hypothetical protein PK095_12550 [Myxococcota bacterium]|nr:hypothetical protein [Myxococcota bacterium]
MDASRLVRGVSYCLFSMFTMSHALAEEPDPRAAERREAGRYRAVIAKVANMVDDARVIDFARVRGLDVVNVTWEDTARFDDSAVGPNISDLTIQVLREVPRRSGTRLEATLMPVIRHPNFSDKTGDVPIDKIRLLVGNERGEALTEVPLATYLGDVRRFLSKPDGWAGEGTSLLAPRDTHVLVSAQAAFLPIPKAGLATFNPVLFNYQSGKKNPAVLAIVATREGTSATIIDNSRDGFEEGGVWGQRLFFNTKGQKASFTGKRLSDTAPEEIDRAASLSLGDEAGLNMVMLIQVPLKQKARRGVAVGSTGFGLSGTGSGGGGFGDGAISNVEAAVIGHGAVEGPFIEVDGLPIERDPRYPIRVTVQFYKATSNGVVSRRDMVQIQSQIKRVLKDADYVGSLVVGPPGRPQRPTDWAGDRREPADWWRNFWGHYERESGWSKEVALRWLGWQRVRASSGAETVSTP